MLACTQSKAKGSKHCGLGDRRVIGMVHYRKYFWRTWSFELTAELTFNHDRLASECLRLHML